MAWNGADDMCVAFTPVHFDGESVSCPLVIVEGNISAGKSTLCRELAKQLNFTVYMEPTLENPFLVKYYKNPKKYALPMQLWLLKQRYKTYVSAVQFAMGCNRRETAGVIMDRSIFSDIVFAEKNFADGNFSAAGYDHYLALRARLLAPLPAPHAVVYLDAAPAVCHARIHSRSRGCEDGIPLEYLAGLHECYHSFLERMRRESNAHVMCHSWDSFGDAGAIAMALRALPLPSLSAWAGDLLALRRFIGDAAAIEARMVMDTTLDEAEGHDAAIADPDAVTASEVVEMTAGEKRRERIAAEFASPVGRPAKVSRVEEEVSPVGVAEMLPFAASPLVATE